MSWKVSFLQVLNCKDTTGQTRQCYRCLLRWGTGISRSIKKASSFKTRLLFAAAFQSPQKGTWQRIFFILSFADFPKCMYKLPPMKNIVWNFSFQGDYIKILKWNPSSLASLRSSGSLLPSIFLPPAFSSSLPSSCSPFLLSLLFFLKNIVSTYNISITVRDKLCKDVKFKSCSCSCSVGGNSFVKHVSR